MNNTMDFTNKSTQAEAAAAMKKLIAEKGEEKAMDEMFELVSQQVKMTREEFEEVFRKGTEQMGSWESDDGVSNELNEEELDMVVGGSAWDWICDHKQAIIVGAAALILGATGAALGATVYMGVIGLSALGSAAVGGTLAGFLGGSFAYVLTMDKDDSQTNNAPTQTPGPILF